MFVIPAALPPTVYLSAWSREVKCLEVDGCRRKHHNRYPRLTLDHRHLRRILVHHHQNWNHQHLSHIIFTDESRVSLSGRHVSWMQQSTSLSTTRRIIRARPSQFYGLTLDSLVNIPWDQNGLFQSGSSVPTCGGVDDNQVLVLGISLGVLIDSQQLLNAFGPFGQGHSIQFARSAPPWSWTRVEICFPSWWGEEHGLLSSSIDVHVAPGWPRLLVSRTWPRTFGKAPCDNPVLLNISLWESTRSWTEWYFWW